MPNVDIERVRALIGQRVLHQGVACLVVELLENEPALVLEALGPREGFQDNQYGAPRRRVAEVFTIPFYDPVSGEEPNPELLALGLLE